MNRLADDINELFLDELRSNFEAGDGIQLLTAVRFCGRNNLPLPEWVVYGYATITCRLGFSLPGNLRQRSIICLVTGQWDFPNLRCTSE